jgi:hypothetical protein
MEDIYSGKEKVKLFLVTHKIILNTENPKISTPKKLLKQINEFSKVIRNKIGIQKIAYKNHFISTH